MRLNRNKWKELTEKMKVITKINERDSVEVNKWERIQIN